MDRLIIGYSHHLHSTLTGRLIFFQNLLALIPFHQTVDKRPLFFVFFSGEPAPERAKHDK